MKYLENAHAIMHSHLVASPIANVLLTHGLFDDNRELYRFLISVLNEYHIDVYELILPYHYERTPARSKFSGEYFWSANVVRAADAIKQSVYEIALAERFIRERTALPVLPVGFSMGGGLTLLALSICPEIARAFVINPVSLMARLAWENPLCRSIREDLQGRGWDFPQVARVFRPFEPLNDLSAPLGHKVVLARGIYDQIIKSEDYELLNQYLRPSTVHEYHAGHISILRVPRLGMNIAEAVQTTLS
jgi:alpha-beta hydrolase superfamily lysophospholipase